MRPQTEDDGKSGLRHRLIGRVMNSLVAVLGPELYSSSLLSAYTQSIAFELRAYADVYISYPQDFHT